MAERWRAPNSVSTTAGAPRGLAGAAARKSPGVWIGKMSPATPDVFIRRLLAECGQVTKYSRTTDPRTQVPATFCVAEFAHGLSAVRATKLLNNLSILGQSWLVKADASLLAQEEAWRAERISRLREVYSNKSNADLAAMLSEEDTTARGNVKALVDAENRAAAVAASAAAQHPADTPSLTPFADEGGIVRGATVSGGYVSREGNTPGNRFNGDTAPVPHATTPQLQPPRPPSRATSSPPISGANAFREAMERAYRPLDLPPEFKGLSTAAHRFAKYNRFLADQRTSLRRSLSAWQADEPRLRTDLQKYHDSDSTLDAAVKVVGEKDCAKLVKWDLADVEYFLSSSGTVSEASELNSRALHERAAQVTSELKKTFAADASSLDPSASALSAVDPSPRQLSPVNLTQQSDPPSPGAMQSVVVPTSTSPIGQSVITDQPPAKTHVQLKLEVNLPTAPLAPQAVSTTVVASVFTAAEEDYAAPALPMDLHVLREAAEKRKEEEELRAFQLVQRIKDRVPVDTALVLNYAIAWDLLSERGVIREKVRPWVCTQLEEMVGEVDEEFTDFIVDRLQQGPSSDSFLEEVKHFFDDDAPNFVLRLWKLLIFESIRLSDERAVAS